MANLFSSALGKLGPALGELNSAGVTDEMWEMIGDKDGVYAKVVYEALMAHRNNKASAFETITVPDNKSAEALIEAAELVFKEAGIPFTYFNENLVEIVRRDLELVCGKTLQVLKHNFGHDWETSEGRDFQKRQGFDGNAAAFLIWVAQTKPMGWFVSIPESDSRLFRDADVDLCAPNFHRVSVRREFSLSGVRPGWRVSRLLVAFREI